MALHGHVSFSSLALATAKLGNLAGEYRRAIQG